MQWILWKNWMNSMHVVFNVTGTINSVFHTNQFTKLYKAKSASSSAHPKTLEKKSTEYCNSDNSSDVPLRCM